MEKKNEEEVKPKGKGIQLVFSEHDNRPKPIIFLDRIIWIVLLILLTMIVIHKTTCNCRIIENDLGNRACITTNGEEACELINITPKDEPNFPNGEIIVKNARWNTS